MTDDKINSEKLKQIVNLLPKENCGKCGFENCGGFALAAVNGKASPFGCHKNPSAGDTICEVLGIQATEEMKASAANLTGRGHHGHRHGVTVGGHDFQHHLHGHHYGEGGTEHSHHCH